MLSRDVLLSVLASLPLAIALPFTAAKAQNPTTPGAIPNPGTYQGSMELQRQSDQRDQELRAQQQREQQQRQQQPQSSPQQGTSRADYGAARQGGGGPPRVMPDFAANDRAMAAVRQHDYASALRIVRPLAERGDMVAEYVLAAMYDRGMGLPEDHAMAMQWYRRSAGEGYSQSMRNLGTMYRNGEAGRIDYVEAYRWYTLAISHLVPGEGGVQELNQNLKEVSAKMSGAQIALAKKLARETNLPFLR
jgi:Sel1 repeat